jgi:hypothetical protein
MSAVSEILVREYFEMHGFFVHQQRKYVAPGQRDLEEIDFVVLHPSHRPPETSPPFVLTSGDLGAIERAVVSVRGWHATTFSPAFLTASPEIFRFAEPAAAEGAARALGGNGVLLKILVVSTLPQGSESRMQSIEMLRSKGIDAVIPFPTILDFLITNIEPNRNYQKSDVLQVIRLLKNYDFLKDPQMELFKTKRVKSPKSKDPAKESDTP